MWIKGLRWAGRAAGLGQLTLKLSQRTGRGKSHGHVCRTFNQPEHVSLLGRHDTSFLIDGTPVVRHTLSL